MRIEVVELSKLKPSLKNTKPHEDVSQIEKSIENLGYRNPIIARDDTFEIVAGHGRLKALLAKGVKEAPIILDKYTDEQADLYRIADNQISNPSDFGLMAEELQRLDDMNLDIEITGISDEEHERIMSYVPSIEKVEKGGKSVKCSLCGR